MVIPSDARAMGAVNAINRGKRFGNKPNRVDYRTGHAAGDCISFKLDADGNMVNPSVFRATRTRKGNRRPLVSADNHHRITAADLAPIGNIL